jgi:CheY-like chemotaxis protein
MPTLLLADDSVTIQRVIELTFADEGIRVVAVGDGESAIARIDQERPDIVLADVGMQGVDGYQVATHVKHSAATANVPVLLLTGAFEPIDEGRARDTGCDGVLVKPFEPRQLIKAVRDLLSGARPAELWPADMPRLDPAPARAEAPPPTPAFVAPIAPAGPSLAVSQPQPVPSPSSDAVELSDDPNVVSLPYQADADSDLAAALARLEFVVVPNAANSPAPIEELDPVMPAESEGAAPASSVEWSLDVASAAATADRPAQGQGNQSLANVFSALLAAERKNPETVASIVSSPALSESAVEEVVKKVVRQMTDEIVRKIVLETAERLIREEIDRIKA